ncbi:MAG: cysteine--tRNA ligase [Planctomycetota bacterium]|nr:cysteine--tRNA ligase [Planctomycetota bacterium]
MLRILNSQSRRKEEFKPLSPGRVTIYTCGPTVYDSLHLGHARAAITPDVVRRYLEYKGCQVRYVTNFTDVDDKIIKRAIAENRNWREITAAYMEEFHRLMLALNVKPADSYPRATDHIPEMLDMVARLLEKKHAYIAGDGDIYFDTSTYARYGGLSGRNLEEEEAGISGRITQERLAVKKHPGDFVLWKLNKNDKEEIARGGRGDMAPRWASPWGDGRPGWHLECSAMSRKYLGVPFDIHCGGQDLLFPHHEDEKAQTECAYSEELGGKESVRYWVHNAFVTVRTPANTDPNAVESSRKLFESWVTEKDLMEFKQHGSIVVTGSAGGRYRIRTGYIINVDALDHEGNVKCRLCVNIPGHPMFNSMLAQYVGIKTDEPGFLKKANVFKPVGDDLVDEATGSVKMSKSLGNVKWLREMIWPDGPYDPMAVRMMLLSSHYRSPIVFEPAMLDEATARLERIYNTLEALERTEHVATAEPIKEWLNQDDQRPGKFDIAMNDDFNTAGALGVLFELASFANRSAAIGALPPLVATQIIVTMKTMLSVLGIRVHSAKAGGTGESEKKLEQMVDQRLHDRQEARKAKQFALADKIRSDLKALGYEVEDLPGGKWAVKKT